MKIARRIPEAAACTRSSKRRTHHRMAISGRAAFTMHARSIRIVPRARSANAEAAATHRIRAAPSAIAGSTPTARADSAHRAETVAPYPTAISVTRRPINARTTPTAKAKADSARSASSTRRPKRGFVRKLVAPPQADVDESVEGVQRSVVSSASPARSSLSLSGHDGGVAARRGPDDAPKVSIELALIVEAHQRRDVARAHAGRE